MCCFDVPVFRFSYVSFMFELLSVSAFCNIYFLFFAFALFINNSASFLDLNGLRILNFYNLSHSSGFSLVLSAAADLSRTTSCSGFPCLVYMPAQLFL